VLGKPPRRFGFGDDRKDFDGFGRDVIENSHASHSESVLWTAQAAQAFNPAFADPTRLMPQMAFESVSHLGALVSRQGLVSLCGLRREDDLISHLARL